MEPALFIAIFVAIFVAVAALAYYQSEQRRKALTAWAERHGFRFRADRDDSWDDRCPGFDCLQQGHSRHGYNFTEGAWKDRPFVAFDYHYVTGSGKNRQTHRFSGVLVESGLPLKPVAIRSENVLHQIQAFFGFDDIDFESAEFSRAFHVKAAEKRWAYDFLPQETLEFLLAAPRFNLQVNGGRILAWLGHVLDPSALESALDVVTGVLERVPRSVVSELQGQSRE